MSQIALEQRRASRKYHKEYFSDVKSFNFFQFIFVKIRNNYLGVNSKYY